MIRKASPRNGSVSTRKYCAGAMLDFRMDRRVLRSPARAAPLPGFDVQAWATPADRKDWPHGSRQIPLPYASLRPLAFPRRSDVTATPSRVRTATSS
jgi:hypothetical protein